MRIWLVAATVALAGCGGDIHRQVEDDAVKQYEMVQQNGTAVDRCVHAGAAAEAFLQGNDQSGYERWKATQAADCAAARAI